MRQSQIFTKTRKQAPSDEVAKNAQLLIRGGFIHKEMAGVYAYLPLGLRVLEKIRGIIRDEINAIGGQELFLTSLQDPEVWKKSGRWSDEAVDNWFKTELANGAKLGLANTHEEPLTALLRNHISSYKDLPVYAYQFQTKFRNELRAKSGIMRGREFLMKDLYSFSRSEEEFRAFYEATAEAYFRIFDRVGLGQVTYRCYASGGSFSEFSDEFQTLSEAGEDTIYVHEGKKIAVNKEVYKDEVLEKIGIAKDELVEKKAIEVGNIFPLGTRFSEAEELTYKDEEGKDQHPIMGCYGIGLGRVMGTVVEVVGTEKGIVWPESISPYRIHLIVIPSDEGRTQAERLYEKLKQQGADVLYDDRDLRAGEKFADADLIGIPFRAVVSAKTAADNKVEFTDRTTGETKLIDEESFLSY